MRHLAPFLALLLACLPTAAAEPPARVLLLGTWHFANPGLDLHNTKSIDVLEAPAQEQIAALVERLARFDPDRVFVEWPAELTDERYAAWLADELPPSRNEVVQLGFRLARMQGHARVHGIDVEGRFPFEAVLDWAKRNGRDGELMAGQGQVAAWTAEIETLQRNEGIAAALRAMNQPGRIDAGHGLYMSMLRFGAGADQPGAELNSAWFERNMRICALLLQQLQAGERAVVIFGAGHLPWLRRCVLDTPGVELEPVAGWLEVD